MRNAISRLLTVALCSGSTSVFVLGHPAEVRAQADEGQVRGRGVLAFNFDFGQGISSYVLGDVRGGKGLFGAGGKAGVRVVW